MESIALHASSPPPAATSPIGHREDSPLNLPPTQSQVSGSQRDKTGRNRDNAGQCCGCKTAACGKQCGCRKKAQVCRLTCKWQAKCTNRQSDSNWGVELKEQDSQTGGNVGDENPEKANEVQEAEEVDNESGNSLDREQKYDSTPPSPTEIEMNVISPTPSAHAMNGIVADLSALSAEVQAYVRKAEMIGRKTSAFEKSMLEHMKAMDKRWNDVHQQVALLLRDSRKGRSEDVIERKVVAEEKVVNPSTSSNKAQPAIAPDREEKDLLKVVLKGLYMNDLAGARATSFVAHTLIQSEVIHEWNDVVSVAPTTVPTTYIIFMANLQAKQFLISHRNRLTSLRIQALDYNPEYARRSSRGRGRFSPPHSLSQTSPHLQYRNDSDILRSATAKVTEPAAFITHPVSSGTQRPPPMDISSWNDRTSTINAASCSTPVGPPNDRIQPSFRPITREEPQPLIEQRGWDAMRHQYESPNPREDMRYPTTAYHHADRYNSPIAAWSHRDIHPRPPHTNVYAAPARYGHIDTPEHKGHNNAFYRDAGSEPAWQAPGHRSAWSRSMWGRPQEDWVQDNTWYNPVQRRPNYQPEDGPHYGSEEYAYGRSRQNSYGRLNEH